VLVPARSLLLVFLSLALIGPAAHAQAPQAPRGQATLVGRVTDAETNAPLASVNVFIATSTRGTTTDADGRFRLPGVPLGAQRLYVSRIGYEPYGVTVSGYHAFERVADQLPKEYRP